jgi:hypothetical protein
MIYALWLLLFIVDLLLLPLAYVLAPVLSLFTAKGWPKWGSWFWTYDNEPQGDGGYQRKRAPYPNTSSPWKLYVNRVCWLWRNPLYGYSKAVGVQYETRLSVKIVRFWGAGVDTSDKYRRAGGYYAECRNMSGDLVAFELYIVAPWSATRCLRARIGWKILTDKFEHNGFAHFVDTFNPLDGYGDK